jgi:hypothetical protein
LWVLNVLRQTGGPFTQFFVGTEFSSLITFRSVSFEESTPRRVSIIVSHEDPSISCDEAPLAPTS